jgi:hypothetical protein
MPCIGGRMNHGENFGCDPPKFGGHAGVHPEHNASEWRNICLIGPWFWSNGNIEERLALWRSAHVPWGQSTQRIIMAADKLDIDIASIQDNPAERQVEFAGEVDADEVQFAVQYDVLEALSGDRPDEDDAIEMFNRFSDEIAEAGLAALARSSDQALVVISENDLE